MQPLETDLLVIGWGKAGKSLVRVLGSAGCSVVTVEQSDQMYGGRPPPMSSRSVVDRSRVHRCRIRDVIARLP